MKKEDIPFLSILVKTLGEYQIKLEEAYSKGNYDEFDKSKQFLLKIHKKIEEVLE